MAALRTGIVDDVEGFRRLIRTILEASDRYEVIGEAGDGEAAVALVEEHEPDLLLLDLSMPGVAGFEALDRIKEAAPDLHVVVLSGHETDRIASEALEHGATGYLEKGMDPEELIEDLDAIVDENALV